jgi:hypothetical protein
LSESRETAKKSPVANKRPTPGETLTQQYNLLVTFPCPLFWIHSNQRKSEQEPATLQSIEEGKIKGTQKKKKREPLFFCFFFFLFFLRREQHCRKGEKIYLPSSLWRDILHNDTIGFLTNDWMLFLNHLIYHHTLFYTYCSWRGSRRRLIASSTISLSYMLIHTA